MGQKNARRLIESSGAILRPNVPHASRDCLGLWNCSDYSPAEEIVNPKIKAHQANLRVRGQTDLVCSYYILGQAIVNPIIKEIFYLLDSDLSVGFYLLDNKFDSN